MLALMDVYKTIVWVWLGWGLVGFAITIVAVVVALLYGLFSREARR